MLLSQPVTVKVTGLPEDAAATVRNVATAPRAAPMSSQAEFRANSAGVIDPAHASSESGTYTGRDPMGLFWSLQPDGPGAIPPFPEPVPRVEADHLSVELGGTIVATRRLTRRLVGPGVSETQLRPDHDGFYGDFFTQQRGRRRPAVLVFGGSEGALARSSSLIAAQLASRGYPALALAYFQEPGLPSGLTNIPLEYFAAALRWLRRQPGVDRHHVLTLGASRGSEAALLLGIHYPNLVAGVIATSPSSIVNSGSPDVTEPAWTLGGAPLVFVPVSENRQPNPPDAADAVIPVEEIRGPILFVCGEADEQRPSCGHIDAMITRLGATRAHLRPTVLRYPAAGHRVDRLVANLGGSPSTEPNARANATASADAWPRILSFLDHTTGSPQQEERQ